MINFLSETKEAIKKHGHTDQEIIFIGIEETGHSCTWEEFQTLADKEYHEDFVEQKVHGDLIIVFSDGSRLYRFGYDGQEEWGFLKPFVLPKKMHKIKTLFLYDDDKLDGYHQWTGEFKKIEENKKV